MKFDDLIVLLKSRKRILIFLTILSCTLGTFGQYTQFQKVDTTQTKSPFFFPLMGEKAVEKGFNIPYPWGIMLNYFTAKQDVTIPEVAIGVSNETSEIPLTDITDLIDFGIVNARATSMTIRPDLWVWPFLDVYGIFGKTYAKTSVEMTYPVHLKTEADLDGTTLGIGITGAGGIGKYFFVLDNNWAWSSMTNFKSPVRTSIFSARIGRAFKVAKGPESNLAWWVGAMRVQMGSVTEGTITLNEVIPQETWNQKDDIVDDYWDWYNNDATIPQKLIADKTLSPFMEKLGNADGSGVIHYQIRKKPEQKWNMLIGGQYQFNKHHQVRAEAGILGNRKSLLVSYNYRFGIFKKY